jgi:hypothetical protein
MAVYLYNLGFTLANAANGNFWDHLGSQTGLGQSDTWFLYNGSGLPTGVTDNVVALGALNSSDWTTMTSAPSFVANADYVLMRIFNTDSPQPSMNLRLTAVMGHGTSTNNPVSSPLQAPFQFNNKARPVVDTDGSTGGNWPGPTGNDGAWTYCIGMIHGVINDYSCNVGATVYVSSGPYLGTSCYGHDPQLHVGGMVAPGTQCDDGDNDVDDESAA